MNTYCKSLHPDDYAGLIEYVDAFEQMARTLPASIEHHHRRWETAMALSAIDCVRGLRDTEGPHRIMEIGSGGSLFAPLATLIGYEVTVVDPSSRVRLHEHQSRKTQRPIRVVQADFMDVDLGRFDYVACLSVIEHVAEDAPFWEKVLETAQYGVALTTDFSLDGRRFSADHLRTYTPEVLEMMASNEGWEPLGEPDYADNGAHVYDYNFASLCMVKTETAVEVATDAWDEGTALEDEASRVFDGEAAE